MREYLSNKVLTVLVIVIITVFISSCTQATVSSTETTTYITTTTEHKAEPTTESTTESTTNTTEPPDPRESIDLNLNPNEVGEIMIIMYHYLAEENSEWGRTIESFKSDLKRLYEMGFVTISMEDYINSNFDIPAGKTPVVLTFDDGHITQFKYIGDGDDRKIDPDCVVGILNDFNEKHPDFGRNAIFYLNGGIPFGQSDSYLDKLKYLDENGYELGNHTWNHDSLGTLGAMDTQETIGKTNKYYKDLTGKHLTSLSLPYGILPTLEAASVVLSGSYEDVEYENKVVLLVGWRPSWPTYINGYDRSGVYRVQSGDAEVQLTWWLDNYESSSKSRFISDGNKDIITVPKGQLENINKELIDIDSLYIYD